LASSSALPWKGEPSSLDTRRRTKPAVTRDGDWLALDFPIIPARRDTPPIDVAAALRTQPAEVLVSRDLLAAFNSEDEVRRSTRIGKR
jgi:hypothetical protein